MSSALKTLVVVETGNVSRFDSVATARIKSFIDEIALLMEERRILRQKLRDASDRAEMMGLSPKVIRQVVQLRNVSPEERREEERLLAVYKAADGLG